MISREEIKHIYALSKLELKDEEIDVTREKFEEVMDYVSKIFEAKTPDEYCQMLATSPGKLREDVPEKSLDRKEALKHAVETEYGYFRLDRVVE